MYKYRKTFTANLDLNRRWV